MEILLALLFLASSLALLTWVLALRKRIAEATATGEGQRQWATAADAEVHRLRAQLAGAVAESNRVRGLFSELIPLSDQAQRLQGEIARLTAVGQATHDRNVAAERDATARLHAILAQQSQATMDASATQQRMGSAIAALQQSLSALEEQSDLQQAGFYRLRYDLGTSAEYQQRIEANRGSQQHMIKSERAVLCSTQWTVNGDARSGQKMVKDHIKLMLRAFNGECDAAVAKARFNNAPTMERRIRAAFDAINKVSESKSSAITPDFLDMKLAELELTVEYLDKKQREVEEQRAIREQMRDEERAQKELDRARDDAEKEERRFQQALEKARRDVAAATGKLKESLEAKISELTANLAAASALKQKAISQAQLTSAGHVYVISNIGSFGEQVYKIGMTRRLDPMERVIELGDASVPFAFDVHAMVYTENAPELERTLHQRFHIRRVNRINERKEFFRVDLEEIERAVKDIVQSLPRHQQRALRFEYTAAAEEHRRTRALELAGSAAPGQPGGKGRSLGTASA